MCFFSPFAGVWPHNLTHLLKFEKNWCTGNGGRGKRSHCAKARRAIALGYQLSRIGIVPLSKQIFTWVGEGKGIKTFANFRRWEQ